ncbi:sigma-54 interaction domain-containing protein [Marinibacterium profundimaris]|uniref:sigma-54 interaction domain-containing protein n=1 Tax=Marinibacterium profundimaris TaxID=1679460 RepID=UPI000B5243C2|nr:sigma 54-interacting transcriptional regulator [Marinibacterium profundimaris]
MPEAKEAATGVSGVIITDTAGGIRIALGAGSDPRVRAMIGDSDWLAGALERRLVPILLSDRRYLGLVTKLEDGCLLLLSAPPSDTALDFVMSVDFTYEILNHVLSDPYDAMAVVDAEGRLVYLSPEHERSLGLRPGEIVGRDVREVFEESRLHHVLRTGVAEIGQIHRLGGRDRVVSRHPIQHDGRIVGAIGRLMCKGPPQLEAMARRINTLEEEIASYRSRAVGMTGPETFLDAIVGESFAIRALKDQIRKIAPLDIPVLIQGADGTGKELVAQALHMQSSRHNARLVTANAKGLPGALLESELFGYQPGSFAGDCKGKAGKLELADRGTIYLDEIGDMPMEVQSKLLRVLQDRLVERVGGETFRRVDVRLISATTRDLDTFIEQDRFRLDLFCRISPVVIAMPTLAERIGDIPLLLQHFAADLARQCNRPPPEIDVSVQEYLMEKSWPGNVRQLRAAVERAMMFAEDGRLTVADFQRDGCPGPGGPPVAAIKASSLPASSPLKHTKLKESLEELENRLISDAIIRFKGNKKKAAEHLGVSRSYLYKKLDMIN